MRAMQCSGEDVLESDQASLCWDCDSKVHCANFLVARHSTSLLCHSCQSTGVKLGPTAVSVCERCMKGKKRGDEVAEEESHDGNEIEALHESTTPFVPVHRSEARADGVGVRADDRDDDDDGSGDSDGDDDDIGDEDEVAVKRVWGWFTQRRDEDDSSDVVKVSIQDQVDALLAWKRSLIFSYVGYSLDSWTRGTTSNTIVCKWEGLACDKMGRLFMIELQHNGLEGNLDNFNFSIFPDLDRLNLGGN
ncbi:hypothetical protein Scep_017441 [Stephania cephalantha]|uniref:Leucine-rich repeat-containing N-terminal plant-type domain-containing protein n=1 Tax=Stephania cephalantha TaxID=152367 RepID=A0AAP0NU87_9MAGN